MLLIFSNTDEPTKQLNAGIVHMQQHSVSCDQSSSLQNPPLKLVQIQACNCRKRCSSMNSCFQTWNEWSRLMMGCSPRPHSHPRRGMSPPCRSSCTMCTAILWLWPPTLTGCMRVWQTPGNIFWTNGKRCGKIAFACFTAWTGNLNGL